MIPHVDRTKSLLLAHLAGNTIRPDDAIEGAINTNYLDTLSAFERLLLPLTFERMKHVSQPITNNQIIRGIHRKMVVRNRLFVTESEKLLTLLQQAGVDAFVFKGGALLGHLLPWHGLRAMGDIDLWVRPSHYEMALKRLGFEGMSLPRPGEHAKSLSIQGGFEVDMHIVPSHWHAARSHAKDAHEHLFESAWQNRVRDRLSNSDLLYFSMLNPLFAHEASDARGAFALLELDTMLAHPDITEDVLLAVRTRVEQDKSAAIFLEHHHWLGEGASPLIDRFFNVAILPAAEPKDLEVIRWLIDTAVTSATNDDAAAWMRFHVRRQALALRKPLEGRSGTYVAILQWLRLSIFREPGVLCKWILQKRSWQRLWKTSCHLLRI